VSSAFRFVLRARQKLYANGILTAMRLHHPVISVGNLTLGGTGKTPLVIALAEGLRDRGFHPVILSRGYGRTSRGIGIVGREAANWEAWGDEPFLMKRRLVHVPVVVGANRYEAGLVAEEKNLGNIFLLDDGFQHWRLHRDVDIVTVDPIEWAAGEILLPVGRWREPKAAIVRAHAACVQDIAGENAPDLPIPSFRVRTEIQGIFTDNAAVPPESFKNRAVVAFAGIAKPERFFSAVESLGIRPVQCVRFPDHYHYSTRDIESLGGELLITTEKDAIRVKTVATRPYSYLRINAKIPDFDDLMSLISRRLQLSCK
jgi:tetraacyldisaccharide 4'-kinase